MKNILLIFAAVSAISSPVIVSAAAITDNFNGTTINSSVWTVQTPYADSSVTEGGGVALLQNRGRLLSVADAPAILDLTGSFRFTGSSYDQFDVVIRSNGVSTNGSSELDKGIAFTMRMQSDTGNTSGNIGIYDYAYPGNATILTTGTYSLVLNTFYNFRITDDGTNLAFYIGNLSTPLLTASDTASSGYKIGLYNREGSAAGSSISAGSKVEIDNVNVIPEPSVGSFIMLVAAFIFIRRRYLITVS